MLQKKSYTFLIFILGDIVVLQTCARTHMPIYILQVHKLVFFLHQISEQQTLYMYIKRTYNNCLISLLHTAVTGSECSKVQVRLYFSLLKIPHYLPITCLVKSKHYGILHTISPQCTSPTSSLTLFTIYHTIYINHMQLSIVLQIHQEVSDFYAYTYGFSLYLELCV